MEKYKSKKALAMVLFFVIVINTNIGCNQGYNKFIENDKTITDENNSNNLEKEEELALEDEEQLNEIEIVKISNAEELTEYLGYDKVSFEEIRIALRNNQNISEKYKKEIKIFIDRLEEKLSLVDLRCFYKKYQIARRN